MYSNWCIIYMVVCYAFRGYGFITDLAPQQHGADKTLTTERDGVPSVKTPENTFLLQQGTGNVGSQTYYYFGQNNENTIIDKMEVQGAHTVNINAAIARNLTSNHNSLADRLLNNSLSWYSHKISNTTSFKLDPQNGSQINHTDFQINSQAAAVGVEKPSSAQTGNAANKNSNNYIISLNGGSAATNNLGQTEKEALETKMDQKLENLRDELKQSMHTLVREMGVSLAAAVSENLRSISKNEMQLSKNMSEDADADDDDGTLSPQEPVFSSAVQSFFKINGYNIIPRVSLNWSNLFDYTFNQYEQKIITSADYVKSLPDFRYLLKKINAVLDGYALDRTRITGVEIFGGKDDEEFVNMSLAKYSEYKDYLINKYGGLVFIIRPTPQNSNTRLMSTQYAAPQLSNNNTSSDYLPTNGRGH